MRNHKLRGGCADHGVGAVVVGRAADGNVHAASQIVHRRSGYVTCATRVNKASNDRGGNDNCYITAC